MARISIRLCRNKRIVNHPDGEIVAASFYTATNFSANRSVFCLFFRNASMIFYMFWKHVGEDRSFSPVLHPAHRPGNVSKGFLRFRFVLEKT